MTALDQQFHISQSRLKRQPVKGIVSVATGPVELASINAPTNAERLSVYVSRRDNARATA